MPFCKKLQAYVFILTLSVAACQSPEQDETQTNNTAAEEQTQTAAADSAAQSERKPAPEFHRIPTDMANNRVYVCDDADADVFHTRYDCELLTACKTVKKNVTLIRAVEVYGRYNCDICSQELSSIFDEQQIIQRR